MKLYFLLIFGIFNIFISSSQVKTFLHDKPIYVDTNFKGKIKNGTISAPFVTMPAIKDSMYIVIKRGSSLNLNNITHNYVKIGSYGSNNAGKLPTIKNSVLIIGGNINLADLIFEDTTSRSLVIISSRTFCTITNCTFISSDKPLVLEKLRSVFMVNVKLKSKYDGLVINDCLSVDLYNVYSSDNALGYSYVITNVEELKTFGVISYKSK